MCLLAFYPAGVGVDTEALFIASESNPDGFGFAVMNNRRTHIKVGKAMKAEPLIERFARARSRNLDAPAMFHCRLTTDGITGNYNNHPFTIVNPEDASDHRTIMAHNGVFPFDARPGKGDLRSDTRIVSETMAGSRWDLRTYQGRDDFGNWMGTGSKVLIMSVDPSYGREGAYLVNGHLGLWENGAWYSNTSHKPHRYEYSDWEYSDGGWYRYPQDGASTYKPSKGMYIDCQMCLGVESVPTITMICTECRSCNECWCHAKACRCKPYFQTPEGKSKAGEALTVAAALEQLGAQGECDSDTGWPEDAGDPELITSLEALVAHVNNGGEI